MDLQDSVLRPRLLALSLSLSLCLSRSVAGFGLFVISKWLRSCTVFWETFSCGLGVEGLPVPSMIHSVGCNIERLNFACVPLSTHCGLQLQYGSQRSSRKAFHAGANFREWPLNPKGSKS